MRLGRYKQDMKLHVPTCTKQINWEFKQDIGLHVNATCDEKVQQLPPNWFIKSKATERVEYVRKEEVKMTEKKRRVRREDEKKSSIENHIEIPRFFGVNTTHPMKLLHMQLCQHLTNILAYSCFPSSSSKLGMCVIIRNNKAKSDCNWFDLYLNTVGWVLPQH